MDTKIILAIAAVAFVAYLMFMKEEGEGFSLGASSYIGPQGSEFSDNPNYAQ
jgi:hypothetical protein